jgi:type II secretory pathway component GspD/PulD (secretin)
MLSSLVASVALVAANPAPATHPRPAQRPASRAPSPARAAVDGDACQRLPAGKRLKLNLKPDTTVVDLVSWISAITCRSFIVPGSIASQTKTVTIVAPQPITAAEAYQLFLSALDSVGLTVYSSGGVLHVIETARIKSAPLPVYVGED